MAQAALLGVGLAVGLLVLGFSVCFPFYEGLRPLLALALVPLVGAGVLTLAGLVFALSQRQPLGPTVAAAAYAAAPVLLLQAVLAVAVVAPLGHFQTRETEVALGLFLLVLSLTWGAALLHSAWVAWLGLPVRLSMPLAGLMAFVAQVLAYWCWVMLAGEGLAFDTSVFF